MTHSQKVEKLYADIKALGLRFPIAELAKATGYSPTTVSEYVSGKKYPSEKFIDAFYASCFDLNTPSSGALQNQISELSERVHRLEKTCKKFLLMKKHKTLKNA